MLGKCNWHLRNYASGLDDFDRALAYREESFSKSPLIAQHRYGLAHLYIQQKQNEKAESLYTRALTVAASSYDHQRISNALDDLSGFYFQMRRYADAEHALKQELTQQAKFFGLLSKEAFATRRFLYTMYELQGKRDQQRALYEDLTARCSDPRYSGSDQANSLAHLAWCYFNLGLYSQTKTTGEKLLSMRMDSNDMDSRVLFTDIHNPALIAEKQDDLTKAEARYKQMLLST